MIRPILEEGPAPAAPAALCLVAGIFAGAWSVSGLVGACILLAVSGSVLLGRARRRRGSFPTRLAFAALWLAAGFAAGRARIATPAAQARAAFLGGAGTGASADVVEGVLADFWSGEPPRARTTLRARRFVAAGAWVPFPAEVVVFVSGESPVLPVADRGDRVRLTGRLEPEDLPPSERDLPLPWPRYRLSVKSARLIQREGLTPVSALTLPNRFLFRALTRAHGAEAEASGVRGPLAALLLGRTSELDRGLVARFRRGGLYHLLVVSGLHVLMAVGLLAWVLTAARIDGKRRDLALLAGVVLIVLVGGANPPAVRAGLVIAIFLVSRLLERPITGAQAAGLSACILFLALPEQVFSIGAVLTFAAVLGIASFARPIGAALPSRPRWLFSGLAAALAAECATAPILLWRFNLVAAGAWLTSPLAIPLSAAMIGVGALVLLLDALGIPADIPGAVFAFGVRALEFMAERAAGIAFLRPTPPLVPVLLVVALLVLAGRTTGRRRAWAAAAAGGVFGALALRAGPAGPAQGFSIEALDVGQGDAILLRWKRRAILVDGGGSFDVVSTDFGRTHLVPKLLDRGVTRLDAVLLTHPHPDHALGLFGVLEELPVPLFVRSCGDDEAGFHARLDALAAARGVAIRPLVDGDVLEFGDARLSVLHSGGRRRKADAVNNQSVVALFERGGKSALLTGDAGAPTETDLLEAGALFPVDVLKVGHHGSRTSTSAALVAALSPRVALLSVRPPQPLRAPGAGDPGHARALLRPCPAHRSPLRLRRRGLGGRHAARLAGDRGPVTDAPRPPLLVVLGPTGSGKTDVAHALARARGGEIVSADAFAVYRGMDVGTAKPSRELREQVRYHMLDVADPEEPFSAGRFAQEARAAVEDIAGRDALPVVCGGSGFYVEALLRGLPPGPARSDSLRAALSAWAGRRGGAAAHRWLAVNDPVSAARIPVGNLKYTLRALEILLLTGAPASKRVSRDPWERRFRVIKLGLSPAAGQLHVRIEDRVRRMWNSGWDEEVRRLLDRGLSSDTNSFQAIGYREVAEWILGRISRTEAENRIVAATRGLVKRQRTWLARESSIHWVVPEEAVARALALLGEAEVRET